MMGTCTVEDITENEQYQESEILLPMLAMFTDFMLISFTFNITQHVTSHNIALRLKFIALQVQQKFIHVNILT